jgi:regulator of sigma E protease
MIVTIIIFVVVIAVLIFVHELGHFLFARWAGIRVDAFAIGFGPSLWSKKVTSAKHGDTTYSINAIPFGGYVKIFGENGDDIEDSGEEKDNGDESASAVPATSSGSRSFVNKPRHIQAAVLFAGILFNFIFAWIILSGAFMAGLPVSAEDYAQYSSRFRDERVLIVDVSPGSPGALAGLQAGDAIVSISSNANSGASLSIADIKSVVDQSAGTPVTVGYIPTGMSTSDISKNPAEIKTVILTPVKGIADIPAGSYAIGIAMDNAATLSLPPLLAAKEGARYTWNAIEATVFGVGSLIAAAFQHNSAVLSEVSGPVGIASLVGQAVENGWTNLILLTAVISINLGVLNLLPFPALDGGRILFVAIEAIIRRPIKAKITNAVNTVGFALLILLMLVVTYHDIIKLI